jgi:hypothetical protein
LLLNYARLSKVCINLEEAQRAKQLHDQATTVTDCRKSLSVIQVAEYGLDAEVAAHLSEDNSPHHFRNRSYISKQGYTPQKGVGW